jgi:hypothetical protein
MTEYKQYRRAQVAEMRPYGHGDDLETARWPNWGLSVSEKLFPRRRAIRDLFLHYWFGR